MLHDESAPKAKRSEPAGNTARDAFAACRRCRAALLCRPPGDDRPARGAPLIRRRRALKRGEFLYRTGDPNHMLYAVCCGSVKSCALNRDGVVQTNGVYLPGELVGLDGTETARHAGEAIALENTQVCEILRQRLQQLSDEAPALRSVLPRLLCEQIAHDQALLGAFVGKKSAPERLAAFLLALSRRYEQRGFPAGEFTLQLSHNDLAEYLGLAKETVCRLFSRFREEGLISQRARRIRILDLQRLGELTTGGPSR